jgi:hypothetical protein
MERRIRQDSRRWLVGAVVVLALAVGLFVSLVRSRRIYVEVANHTREPIENVRLTFGSQGTSTGLPSIEPGQAHGMYIPRRAVAALALSYTRPGGERCDKIRAGFGPHDDFRLEPRIRFGIIPDPSQTSKNSFYIKRRRFYDPARLFGP